MGKLIQERSDNFRLTRIVLNITLLVDYQKSSKISVFEQLFLMGKCEKARESGVVWWIEMFNLDTRYFLALES